MPLRLIEVYAAPSDMDIVAAVARRFEPLTVCHVPSSATAAIECCKIVARQEHVQEMIDQLQTALGKGDGWRITISAIEATIPELAEAGDSKPSPEQATREELYAEVHRGAHIDNTFLLLTVLSTVVAAIGLLENSLAIVIAAMLIAPLLGPNLAMAFGSTLGDGELIRRAAVATAAGLALSVAVAAVAGVALPGTVPGAEMLARTRLGYDSILLALAAGAAGALSLTTRLPAGLVGVMVAVALLPPAVALGYMLGSLRFALAAGAAALLAVNLVCVNLAAQIVFLADGIKPRTWIERRAAQQSSKISLAIACGLLAVLVVVIYLRRG